MDSHFRYFAGLFVKNTSLEAAWEAFEVCWLSTIWPPTAVSCDQAFRKGVLRDILQYIGTAPHKLPPRRHFKNVLESKHFFIRSMFL